MNPVLETADIERREHRDPEAGGTAKPKLSQTRAAWPIQRRNLVLLLHERAAIERLRLFRDANDVFALRHDAAFKQCARAGRPATAVRGEYVQEGSSEIIDLAAQPRDPILLSWHVEHRDVLAERLVCGAIAFLEPCPVGGRGSRIRVEQRIPDVHRNP